MPECRQTRRTTSYCLSINCSPTCPLMHTHTHTHLDQLTAVVHCLPYSACLSACHPDQREHRSSLRRGFTTTKDSLFSPFLIHVFFWSTFVSFFIFFSFLLLLFASTTIRCFSFFFFFFLFLLIQLNTNRRTVFLIFSHPLSDCSCNIQDVSAGARRSLAVSLCKCLIIAERALSFTLIHSHSHSLLLGSSSSSGHHLSIARLLLLSVNRIECEELNCSFSARWRNGIGNGFIQWMADCPQWGQWWW